MFEGFFSAVGGSLAGSVARAPWGWGVLVILIGFFVKLRPIMVKLNAAREETLLAGRAADNADLKNRVDALEKRLETERTQHDAERAADRHRINNLTQCLDALLMLLEAAPDKAAQHVARIKEMRAMQSTSEAAEKGAIHAAVIIAATPKAPE